MITGEVVSNQYCIYDHPSDYPDYFVMRRWDIISGNLDPVPHTDYRLAKTLEEIRSWVPKGYHCLPRMRGDDPCIIETWI